MAALIFPHRWKTPPSSALELNGAHPLARGLIAFVPLAAVHGLVNLVNGRGPSQATVPLSWDVARGHTGKTVGRIGRRFVAASSQYAAFPVVGATSFGWSLAAGHLNGTPSNSTHPITASQVTGTDYSGYGHYMSSGGQMRFAAFGSAGTIVGRIDGPSYVASESYRQMFVSYANNSRALIQDRDTPKTSAIDAGTILAPTHLIIGAKYLSGSLTAFSNGVHEYAALWNRGLSTAEAWAFNENPWQVTRSTRGRVYFVPSGAGGVTGTGAITLGSITIEGTAERAVTGTGSIALGAIEVASTANRSYAATGEITLGSITVNGTGIREVTGTGAIALGSAAVNGTGERAVTGVGAVTLGAVTADGTGTVTSAGTHTGTGAIVLGAATVEGAGVREVTGTGAITLSGLQVAVTANRSYTATGEIVLNGIQVSGAGPTVADEIVTGGFWHAFEQAQLRRKKKLREIEEAEEEAQSIKEKMDREIALLLREQERQDAERQEQERLRELARRYATDRAQDLYGERVAKAMARAAVQGNFSAIEALVREASRAQEEEIFLLQATALAIELNS